MKSLTIEHFKYRTQLTDKYLNRKPYEKKDPNKITAFIPGTIRKINIKVGDKVKEGDFLLTLEAMKMKNRILSPMDGTIKAIHAETDKTVAKDALLIEIEPSGHIF